MGWAPSWGTACALPSEATQTRWWYCKQKANRAVRDETKSKSKDQRCWDQIMCFGHRGLLTLVARESPFKARVLHLTQKRWHNYGFLCIFFLKVHNTFWCLNNGSRIWFDTYNWKFRLDRWHHPSVSHLPRISSSSATPLKWSVS